ncbi:NAD(P)H-hydrate dehydratase [Xylophilus sp. Leaf220]|uniref:NAD(P)H-hydrate dehydratase n=1 Tax=Xylophilus sp. Leaf220 TaxID=1735686 RepID=UPI0006F91312|nr:NAD(P)H-hydrate dehydratase [Xylophilus sp. Leaf220]KQM68728.1 carbohydrate kinase [Xylophilus sp. Leaf220]
MLQRILADRAHPLHDTAATRRIEAAALAGAPPDALMQRAGAAVARLAQALAPHARRIWIACGPGNNGGDGLEAAVQLRRAGRPVCVTHWADPARLPADARAALERARAASVDFVAPPAPGTLSQQDLCIDALLGIGGAPRPAPQTDPGTPGRGDALPPDWLDAALDAMAQAGAPVLAIDLPSGLGADTGAYATKTIADSRRGSPAAALFHADSTLSLLTLKPGLFTAEGRDRAGSVWLDTLGVTDDAAAPATAWLSGPAAAPRRSHASHKGSFGDVAVLGGEGIGHRGRGMAGAAVLAATAALHAGAGRVLLALLDGNAGFGLDVSQPELMLRTPDALDLDDGALVCGCGGGEALRSHLPRVLDRAARLVLDADALNLVAADAGLQQRLARRAAAGHATVLTPHPLEAARLLGTDTQAVQGDRLAAARRLAERFGCAVVVKGSGSIVAAPGRLPRINPTGNGRLATAGTGDVLAGMVGARLAAGLEAFDAAADAAYTHGALADGWPMDLPLTAGALARRHG